MEKVKTERTPMKSTEKLAKWIDLNDSSGAKLKLATIAIQGEPTLHIFVTGLSFSNPKWTRAIRELGFNAPPSRKYLVRKCDPSVPLLVSHFQKVFTQARLVDMAPESYSLNVPNKAAPGSDQAPAIDMRGVRRLGRNADEFEVFDSLSGRFYVGSKGERVVESEAIQPHLFLRLQLNGKPLPEGAELDAALAKTASGFVHAMELGEVQHSEDYESFKGAIFPSQVPEHADEMISTALDGALLSFVQQRYDVPAEAYPAMSRLYDYLPPYRGKRRGDGVLPAPLAIAAQRLLGDTTGKVILYPNAFDGAAFAFLPVGTQIRAYAGQEGVIDLSAFALRKEGVTWHGKFAVASEVGAEGLLFNADPLVDSAGYRRDYIDGLQCLRSLASGARAVLALAADGNVPGELNVESSRFLRAIANRYSLEDVFETAPILTRKSGGSKGLRIFSIRNVEPADRAAQLADVDGYVASGIPVLTSWDGVKSHVDETIHRIDIKEAETQSVDLERASANESYQRPYISFSKVGEARTMLPANIHSSVQSYMTRLESLYGPIDQFAMTQLGMGLETLTANFAPEQVDGVSAMIARILTGRASILADDTGLGKGRQLAALATWANKRNENVIFITDKANLFSDFARDLKHIGEWDRFRPMVLNADGEITYEEYPGAEPTVLAKNISPSVMATVLEQNRSIEDMQVNLVFLTYSQISSIDSEKALWIKNQLANSLVIFDESHKAAGSDSNIATHVVEIAAQAKHVQFASATWAKSHDNMHIYQRCFPASVSVSTLSQTMRTGGDSIGEIFSSMLAAEGALIRREHDLSKLEIQMVIDDVSRARNEDVSDKVADVLGAASFISGDMQQVFIRSNAQSVAKLKGARDVRSKSMKAKLFSSSFGAGSVIYQVMKSVQGALNADHVANLAIESLRKGQKPVIVSDATGESLIEAMIADVMISQPGAQRPDQMAMPTLRDVLRHVIYRRLATVRVEDVTAEDIISREITAEPPAALTLDDDAADADNTTEVAIEALGLNAQALPLAPAIPIVPAEVAVDVQAAFAAVMGARAATSTVPVANEPAAPVAATEGDDTAIPVEDAVDGEDGEPAPPVKRRKRIFRDVLVQDLDDLPEQAKERYAAGLKELEEKIMLVPDVPVIGFDVIAQKIRDAGYSVGEISGRKNALFRGADAGASWDTCMLVPRATSKKAVKAVIRSFNNGSTDAMILNRSAAAGVSMHASPQFIDRSRRHLIEHQIPEDPIDRIQLLGRVNRYDQLSTPLISSATTGIFGEVRYLMMQNRKLARMSANVRSSRDNAMALKGVVDLFNVVGRQAVQSFLTDSPLIAKRLGISDQETTFDLEIVNRLTMRIPLLRVSQQKVVYDELYERFDEILVRAELEGENPLRPNEFDVRAKTESEIVYFGDDVESDEFISAFDAPVMARKITWEKETNPISFLATTEAVKINEERLVASGYLTVSDSGSGFVVNPDILKKIIDGYHGITRLAHLASDADSYEAAMVDFPAARRTYLKYTWIKNNLAKMVPGAIVGSVFAEQTADQITNVMEAVVLIDVKPPANEDDLLNPGKWKLTVLASGDERPRTFTLRSVLTSMSGMVAKGEVTGDLYANLFGPDMRVGIQGTSRSRIENYFDTALRGRVVQKRTVLTGNMYLASDWAAATRQGSPAVYTDEAGHRHRVIMLNKDAKNLAPEYIPVRLADKDMLSHFLLLLCIPPGSEVPEVHADNEEAEGQEGQGGEGHVEPVIEAVAVVETDPAMEVPGYFVMDTTFKSATAALSEFNFTKREALIIVEQGKSISISCASADVKRIRASISSGQTGIRRALLGPTAKAADDSDHVVVRTAVAKKDIAKLGVNIARLMGLGSLLEQSAIAGLTSHSVFKRAVVSLVFKTSSQALRAISLLRESSGLEVYVTSNLLKERARLSVATVMGARREASRQIQTQARAEVLAAGPAAPLANSGSSVNEAPQTGATALKDTDDDRENPSELVDSMS